MKTYEVLIAGKWERVQGRVFRRWLDWKSKDGSNGLTRPGKWREIAEQEKQPMKTRTETCPQCGADVIQPRDSEDYCEECGWPNENRPKEGEQL